MRVGPKMVDTIIKMLCNNKVPIKEVEKLLPGIKNSDNLARDLEMKVRGLDDDSLYKLYYRCKYHMKK